MRLTTLAQREMWKKLLADLPSLPRGRTDAEGKNPQTPADMAPDGTEILLTAEKFSKTANVENPELYAVFPFCIFGVNLPELEFARATYDARRSKAARAGGRMASRRRA